MRKVISIFLFALLIFHSTGILLLFKVQEYRAKQEMKTLIRSGLADTELTLVKKSELVNDGLNSILHFFEENEFRYNGIMYDIVREETHGKEIWYYCIRDDKETWLLSGMENLIRDELNQNPRHKKELGTYLRFLSSNYVGAETFIDYSESKKEFFDFTESQHIKTWVTIPQSPPPKSTLRPSCA